MGNKIKLIVESQNDKAFFEAYIEHINPSFENIKDIIAERLEFTTIAGGIDKLDKVLTQLKDDYQGYNLSKNKIGVILDRDTSDEDCLMEKINDKITTIFKREGKLSNKVYSIEYPTNENSLEFHYLFIIENLEQLIKRIATKKDHAPYTNCLDAWQTCLEQKGVQLLPKEFDKHWVNNYIRYDTCLTNLHKSNRDKFCNQAKFNVLVKEKGLFDFESRELHEIKLFLQQLWT
ncbi:MAG: hypothetical protein QM528_07140 [Phycisphaerales bacterium]|nr:hypothetical protein [Phycisphaerales bacterium]